MSDNKNNIEFDSILLDLKANSVKRVFQLFDTQVKKLVGTPENTIFDHLMQNFKTENCTIGNGVAIPHIRLPRLTRPMIIFAKIPKGIDFGSVDGEPVDVICFILSPEYEGPIHLQRLARMTRFFKDQEIVSQLREAEDKDDVRMILRHQNNLRIAA